MAGGADALWFFRLLSRPLGGRAPEDRGQSHGRPGSRVARRRDRAWVDILWIAAGIVAVTGFVLRPLGTFFGRELRYTGIVVIAIGAAIAVIAWLGERMHRRKHPS